MQSNYICHHGVKGMHWGVRRYQNYDGSLKSSGKQRYNEATSKMFTASNGVKVAPAKNKRAKLGRALVRMTSPTFTNNRNTTRNLLKNDTYTRNLTKKSAENTAERIRKERHALDEHNAYLKDAKRGTGTKYLDAAKQRTKMDNVYQNIDKKTSLGQRLLYGDAVRQNAAKMSVTQNIPVSKAMKKAKRNAWITAGIGVAIAVGDVVLQSKK